MGPIEFKVKRIGNGWYDFSGLPQGYIQIHGLNCGTDKKALNRAKKILGSAFQQGDSIVLVD